MLLEEILSEKFTFKDYKKYQIPLTPEEKAEVKDKKAVWSNNDMAIWKSNKDGKTTYITNTHRAMQARPTLKGAISIFHSFIKGTA